MGDRQDATADGVLNSLIKRLERTVDHFHKGLSKAISGRSPLSEPVNVGTGTVVHCSISHCGAVYNAFGIVIEESDDQVTIFPLGRSETLVMHSTRGADMPIVPSSLPIVSDPLPTGGPESGNPRICAPFLDSSIYAGKMQDRSGLILVPIKYVGSVPPTRAASAFLQDISAFRIWDGLPKSFDHCR